MIKARERKLEKVGGAGVGRRRRISRGWWKGIEKEEGRGTNWQRQIRMIKCSSNKE
jgi:hypothetical protein